LNTNEEVKILPKKKILPQEGFCPPTLRTELKKDWNKGGNCRYKLEETWLGFKEIEKGIGSANLPP
jgi:hypothetical protein